MHITCLSVCVLFSFFCLGFTQVGKDTASIDRLNKRAWELRQTNMETSRSVALQALSAARQMGYIRGMSYSYNILGHYCKEKGLHDSTFLYYNASLKIRKQLRDTLNISRSLRNVMGILQQMGKNKAALDTGLRALQLLQFLSPTHEVVKEKAHLQVNLSAAYLQISSYSAGLLQAISAEKLFKELGDQQGLVSACISLGCVYEAQEYFDKALLQYKKAMYIAEALEDPPELAKIYNNIGNVYYYTDEPDSALHYYLQSLHLREKSGFEDDALGSLLNIGTIYQEKKNLNEADKYYLKCYEQSKSSGNARIRYESAMAIGELRYKTNHPLSALPFLQEAYDVSLNSDLITERMILSKTLYDVFMALSMKDSAIRYLEVYTRLQDSVNTRNLQFLKLQEHLSEQEQNLVLAQARNASQQLWLVIAVIIVLLLTLMIFFIYTRGKSKQVVLELQNRINAFELKSADARLEGQETERQRLAVELHDTLGSILSAAKISFKSMEQSLQQLLTENKTQFDHIQTMLDEAADKVRQIAHDMASGVLQEVGLAEALGRLCRTLDQSTGVRVKLEDVHGLEERLDYGKELNLYRIVQELLTNVLKHAQAKEVTVQITRRGDTINLVVDDDGKGFEVQTHRPGMGLKNIEARVKALHGTWTIDSGKGKGTTVLVDIPIQSQQQTQTT